MHLRGRNMATGRREPLQTRPGVRGGGAYLRCEICGASLLYGREKVERRCLKHPKEKS